MVISVKFYIFRVFSYSRLSKMDVMCPDLLWIGDRCYRLPFQDSSSPEEDNLKPEKVEWVETEPNCSDDEDDESDVEQLIETLPNDRYKLCLPISQAFWSKLIGFKGVTKKRIESDTKTTIIIPRPMEHGDVIIKGDSKRNIILAKKSIDEIVLSSRSKLVFTHFISIPMNNAEIKKNFIDFKDQVLKSFSKDRGIDESIFQNPDKLHLTIATLVLTDQNERKLAEKRLNEVYEKTIKPLIAKKSSCKINVKGIEYMNDDPAEVDVLYGKIDPQSESDLVQEVADCILKHFSHHKLIKPESREQVKLHITLMNTLFREEELEEVNEEAASLNKNKSKKKARRTFNAVNILSKFQDFYFGAQELKTIELSVRFSTAKDGYYKSSCVINL